MGYLDAAVMGESLTDGEVRLSKSDRPYLRVGVAHGSGTVWVTLFGDEAHALAPQVRKGIKVYAEGQLTVELREHDGRSFVATTMVARRLLILGQIGVAHPGNDKRTRVVGEPRRSRKAAPSAEPYKPIDAPFNDAMPF